MPDPTEPLVHARWVVLSLAPVQWFLTWCLRYANVIPIRRSIKAAVAGLIAVTAVLGTLILQTKVYRSITGIDVPAHDNYFFATVVVQDIVSICVIFRIAFDLRRKNAG